MHANQKTSKNKLLNRKTAEENNSESSSDKKIENFFLFVKEKSQSQLSIAPRPVLDTVNPTRPGFEPMASEVVAQCVSDNALGYHLGYVKCNTRKYLLMYFFKLNIKFFINYF